MRPKMRVIQTMQGQEKPWEELDTLYLDEVYNFRMDTVEVDSSKEFQTHLGFGGAFTEAAAYTLAESSPENRKKIVSAYFNKETGLGYNMGRTTIHACDFSLEPYTYIEEGDSDLKTFDISREEQWVIPFIKEAQKEANDNLMLLCSPWSPPAFMKNNKDINHGGRLLKKYYKTWAKYMVSYIKEMDKRGISLSMVSVQNEPEAKQTWASCKFDALEEAEFAVKYLYPELKKEGLSDIHILIWDHNRDKMYRRVKESFSFPEAREIVWGVAYHWYVSEQSEILSMVHDKFPEKHLIFSEGCVELVNSSGSTSSKEGIGAWKHGETYGRNIIKDFNNYSEAWIDWNLLLNEKGGPNYVGNYCEAPILFNREKDEVVFAASYYYIGHFSRYIKPGAKRIQCTTDSEKGIYCVAYKNPNGEIVIVVQNEGHRMHRIALEVDGRGANTKLPSHSITTFILENLD